MTFRKNIRIRHGCRDRGIHSYLLNCLTTRYTLADIPFVLLVAFQTYTTVVDHTAVVTGKLNQDVI